MKVALYWLAVITLSFVLLAIPGVGVLLALTVVTAGILGHSKLRSGNLNHNHVRRTDRGKDVVDEAPIPIENVRTLIHLASGGRQRVAGESYRTEAIRRIIGSRRVPGVGDWDAGLRETALLEREPTNPHDPNAIRVLLRDGHEYVKVGYLPHDDAPAWQPVLREVERHGALAACQASIYRARTRHRTYSVVLHLPEPVAALPGYNPPVGAVILDAERQCAVNRTQAYQDALQARDGWVGFIWATLHPGTVEAGKHKGQASIEVRIDGQKAGVLSAQQGQRYGTLLDRGQLVACEAFIKVNDHGRRDVNLRLPKVD
jgi:hypothetical protein